MFKEHHTNAIITNKYTQIVIEAPDFLGLTKASNSRLKAINICYTCWSIKKCTKAPQKKRHIENQSFTI